MYNRRPMRVCVCMHMRSYSRSGERALARSELKVVVCRKFVHYRNSNCTHVHDFSAHYRVAWNTVHVENTNRLYVHVFPDRRGRPGPTSCLGYSLTGLLGRQSCNGPWNSKPFLLYSYTLLEINDVESTTSFLDRFDSEMKMKVRAVGHVFSVFVHLCQQAYGHELLFSVLIHCSTC